MNSKLEKHRNRILIFSVLIFIVGMINTGGVTSFYQPIVYGVTGLGMLLAVLITIFIETKKDNSKLYFFVDTVSVIWVFFLVFYLMISFVLFPARVNGASMMPNFEHNDVILVWKLKSSYEFSDVVFVNVTKERTNHDMDEYFLKRVIGTPGDSVNYENNALYINDKIVREEFLNKLLIKTYDFDFDSICTIKEDKCSGVIPDDYYFVLGDNRENSLDSRDIGLIHKDDLFGEVILDMMRLKIW